MPPAIQNIVGGGSITAFGPVANTGQIPIFTANPPAKAAPPQAAATPAAVAAPAAPAGPSAATLAALMAEQGAIGGQAGASSSAAAEGLLNNPNGILATIKNLQLGQYKVDQEGVQANLAKNQGLQGVNRMVNEGVQSGGITLANNNASNSSAANALARAYGIEGRDAASQVGNQFALASHTQQTDQMTQNAQEEMGVNSLKDQKTQAINSIVQTATNQLNSLATSAIYANAPQLIHIQQQEDQIRGAATAALSQYDGQIASAGTPTQMTPEEIAAQAQNLATAGTAATAPYTYTNVAPPALQGTGPTPSPLPIYVAPTKDKTTAPA